MRLEIENAARPVDGPVIQLRHVDESPVLMTREWVFIHWAHTWECP